MIYILDAYNVIHKMRRFDAALDKDLRTAREALITVCAGLAQSRGDITGMLLVFDGRSEFRGMTQTTLPKVRLVFSETNEKADERINALLEAMPDKPAKCVVSDDNFVRNHARVYSCKIMSVAEFEKMTVPSREKSKLRPKTKHTAGPQKAPLPPKVADEITESYRKKLGL